MPNGINAQAFWGLPDWQNENSYGNTNKWSIDRWRWEFLRRRNAYRQLFNDLAPRDYQNLIERRGPTNDYGARWLRPDEPGFCALLDDMQSFWSIGLQLLPNPTISNQPDHVIIFEHPKLYFFSGENSPRPDRDEIGVVLNLNERWTDQAKTIEQHFKKAQMQLLGCVKAHKLHPKLWFRYLRIHDGRECGASWSTLASISSAKSNAQTPKMAEQVWNAASKLVNSWPS